jgi:hypothetical protein
MPLIPPEPIPLIPVPGAGVGEGDGVGVGVGVGVVLGQKKAKLPDCDATPAALRSLRLSLAVVWQAEHEPTDGDGVAGAQALVTDLAMPLVA